MTNIICFITPATIAKIGSGAVDWIPVLGSTLEFSKKAKKVTEITDPVSASARGVGILFNYCFGKAGAVSLECIIWLGCSVAGGATGNPIVIGLGAQFGKMVIEEIID